MKHEYEPSHNAEFRRDCMDQALAYLGDVRRTLRLPHERVSVSAACESPLYEGIVGKVQQSQSDWVVKTAGGLGSGAWRIPDSNDWQLMRSCPVTLMLNRGRIWRTRPRIAAAVDISAQETAGLAGNILETAEALRSVYDGELDVIYAAPAGLEQKTRDDHERALRKLAQTSNVSSDRIHILDGQPETALPEFAAKRSYDVLVIGALTHRPDAVALVGTLTAKLVDIINCDFVLVKAAIRSSP
jgi:universal stress protein E